MKRILVAFGLLIIVVGGARAQPEIWLKVEAGTVLYLVPGQSDWVPSEDRQIVPARAFLLTQSDAKAELFRATESFRVPGGAYVFVEDVFPKTRIELVDALTRIEASQLPDAAPTEPRRRPLGLTYGAPTHDARPTTDLLPHEPERRRAVAYFYEEGRYDAALLTLKRWMSRFPELYEDDANVDLLLDLYGRFQLYGFMLDECDRLMQRPTTEPVAAVLREWRDVAAEALAIPRR